MASALWQLTLSRWRMFYRERGALFWTCGYPILLAIALGLAFRTRPPDPLFVAIKDGAGADRLEETLSANSDIRAEVLSTEDANQQLRTGKVALVVEPGAPRSYTFDPTRPESRLARALVDDVLQRADGRKDAAATVDALVTEPGSRYIDFLLPGLIGLNLMSGSILGIGFVIVDMRNRKLMKRLMATPMRRTHFLASFLGLRGMILAVELPILLIFAWLAFSMPVRGSLALFVALSVLGALAFTGIGLLVASRATNTHMVNGLMNLIMLPMFLLSGVFFSAAHFPQAFQPLIRALPLTALNDSLRAVMIDGAGIRDVTIPAAILGAWGLVTFSIALRIFRWR